MSAIWCEPSRRRYFLAGRLAQLEDHGERRHAAEAALGLGGPEAHGRKGAFDGIGGANVLPVLGREVVEGEQHVALELCHGPCKPALAFDDPLTAKSGLPTARRGARIAPICLCKSAKGCMASCNPLQISKTDFIPSDERPAAWAAARSASLRFPFMSHPFEWLPWQAHHERGSLSSFRKLTNASRANRYQNRSRRTLFHRLGHGPAGRGDEVVEFLVALGVEQILALERDHHVDRAVDRLDECGVTGRQGGRGRLAEPVLGVKRLSILTPDWSGPLGSDSFRRPPYIPHLPSGQS